MLELSPMDIKYLKNVTFSIKRDKDCKRVVKNTIRDILERKYSISNFNIKLSNIEVKMDLPYMSNRQKIIFHYSFNKSDSDIIRIVPDIINSLSNTKHESVHYETFYLHRYLDSYDNLFYLDSVFKNNIESVNDIITKAIRKVGIVVTNHYTNSNVNEYSPFCSLLRMVLLNINSCEYNDDISKYYGSWKLKINNYTEDGLFFTYNTLGDIITYIYTLHLKDKHRSFSNLKHGSWLERLCNFIASTIIYSHYETRLGEEYQIDLDKDSSQVVSFKDYKPNDITFFTFSCNLDKSLMTFTNQDVKRIEKFLRSYETNDVGNEKFNYNALVNFKESQSTYYLKEIHKFYSLELYKFFVSNVEDLMVLYDAIYCNVDYRNSNPINPDNRVVLQTEKQNVVCDANDIISSLR